MAVPTRIELLTSLQRLDQNIREKQIEAEEAARRVRGLEATVERGAAEARQLRETLDEAKARQVALERELAEIEEKMKDRRMRLRRVRNEKELQATQREINLMKERTGELEEQELQILEEAETLTARVSAAEEDLRKGQEALDQERAELLRREAALATEVDRDREERAAVAASLDGGLLSRYELIFSRRGGTAVVAVRDGICQGCHMNVPPQLFNQILKGESVFACPSCHRLLFVEPGDCGPAGA